MNKHTPGEWRVYNGWVHPSFDGPGPETTNGDTAICEPLGPDKEANAHLIAAAPELLEACEGLLNALPSATTHPAIKAARAAIAKAKGEGR